MTLPLLFLAIYFTVIALTARFFSRRIHNLKDFFLAGRTLGALPVALSFAASWFGAGSTMGSINAFHDEGMAGAWAIVIPSVLSFIVITFLLAKPIARQAHLSQPEAVEAHYGRAGRLLLSLVILASTTALIGSQMVAGGKVFQSVFGLDIRLATLITTAIVVAYSMAGGYFTVVVTDIAQIGFVLVGFLILFFFTAHQAIPDAAAWAEFWRHPPLAHFWTLGANWPQNCAMVFTFVLAWCIAPELWQRMSSTRNEAAAFRAGWLASGIMLLLFALVMAIGLLSTRVISHSDAVLVALALKIPVPALSALVLLGFVAAVTSAMDSSINVGSLTLTRDCYQGFLRPGASDRELLWVSRLSTALIVLPAMAIALYYQDIIRILWISADIYASCMFFPIVGLLVLKRPARWSGIFAMAGGGIVVLLSMLFQNHWLPVAVAWPVWPYSTLLGVAVSGLGFALGQWISKPGAASAERLKAKSG